MPNVHIPDPSISASGQITQYTTMSKEKLLALSVSLGVSVSSVALATAPASAAQLTFLPSFGGEATELWKVESMIGGTGKELFLATDGSNGPTPSTADWTWTDAKSYNWRLLWDGNFATFTLFDGAIDNSFSRTVKYDVVNTSVFGLEIKTRVDARSTTKVAPDTTANLKLMTLNGEDISAYNAQSNTKGVAGIDTWNKVYIASPDFGNSFNLTGTAMFDWPSFNPQSKNAGARLEFQIEGNSDPRLLTAFSSLRTLSTTSVASSPRLAMTTASDDASSKSVPEPTTLAGLGSVLFGLGFMKRRKPKA